MHVLWLPSYKSLENTSYSDRKQIGGCLGDRQGSMVGAIGKFRVLNVFTILIVMMVSWVCTYVKAPNCTFRYVQLILWKLCHQRKKLFKKNVFLARNILNLFQIKIHRQQSSVAYDDPLSTNWLLPIALFHQCQSIWEIPHLFSPWLQFNIHCYPV